MRYALESDPIRVDGALRDAGHRGGYVSIGIDWMTTEELDETIRPICLTFIARVGLRQRARTT